MNVAQFNSLSDAAAREQLSRCCGSARWVAQMLAGRPFADFDALLIAADQAFATLGRGDWLDAFAHHPKIGGVDALREKFASTAQWSSAEQGGVAAADDDTLGRLADGNDAYERKFGYIFIVCATGKSAGEMLAILESRLANDADAELRTAAVEQMKITDIRLHKLIEP